MIGNWGHGCHSGREIGEYQKANGTSFAEVQDILRVHDSGPFTTIILPYRKTETPSRTVTQQSCGVQIVQGTETTCFNGSMASCAGRKGRILTTYDASTQLAFGFTASGGPQEVVVQSDQIVWTLNGVQAGVRSLTLPGTWKIRMSRLGAGTFTLSNNTFSYNYAGTGHRTSAACPSDDHILAAPVALNAGYQNVRPDA